MESMTPRSRSRMDDRPATDATFSRGTPSETDRLDVQHYALRTVLGVNHLAPVTRAGRLLDAGCGTGQWTFDLCAEIAGTILVGLDLVAPKPDAPPNFRSVRWGIC